MLGSPALEHGEMVGEPGPGMDILEFEPPQEVEQSQRRVDPCRGCFRGVLLVRMKHRRMKQGCGKQNISSIIGQGGAFLRASPAVVGVQS